jgi:hypothetical protein
MPVGIRLEVVFVESDVWAIVPVADNVTMADTDARAVENRMLLLSRRKYWKEERSGRCFVLKGKVIQDGRSSESQVVIVSDCDGEANVTDVQASKRKRKNEGMI